MFLPKPRLKTSLSATPGFSKSPMRRLLLLIVLIQVAGFMAAPVHAAERADTPAADAGAAKKEPKKSPKQAAAPRANAAGGSGETTAERQARLRRECKGRPNAGACTGYTD